MQLWPHSAHARLRGGGKRACSSPTTEQSECATSAKQTTSHLKVGVSMLFSTEKGSGVKWMAATCMAEQHISLR